MAQIVEQYAVSSRFLMFFLKTAYSFLSNVHACYFVTMLVPADATESTT